MVAGHRMRADEAICQPERIRLGDDARLRAADVGDQLARFSRAARDAQHIDGRVDRNRDHDHVRAATPASVASSCIAHDAVRAARRQMLARSASYARTSHAARGEIAASEPPIRPSPMTAALRSHRSLRSGFARALRASLLLRAARHADDLPEDFSHRLRREARVARDAVTRRITAASRVGSRIGRPATRLSSPVRLPSASRRASSATIVVVDALDLFAALRELRRRARAFDRRRRSCDGPSAGAASARCVRPAAAANAAELPHHLRERRRARATDRRPTARTPDPGCTSTISPSAPAAIAANASGATSDASPPAWLGSTITGRCDLALQHRDRGDVERVARRRLVGADAALAQHDVVVAVAP